MSSIHFVGGEKGGVGKSVFARLLCQWVLDQSASLCALDADPSHHSLVRNYPQHGHAVDLTSFESADQIMDRALGAEREVIVDLPAKSLRHLLRWIGEGDVVTFAKEMQVRLVYWQVTDGSFHSMNTLEETLPELDPAVELIVVRNQRWTTDFSQLEASAAVRQLKARGGKLIHLPMLHPPLMYKLEQRSIGLGAARDQQQSSGSSLTTMERQRVAHWTARAYSQFQPIMAGDDRALEPAATEHSALENSAIDPAAGEHPALEHPAPENSAQDASATVSAEPAETSPLRGTSKAGDTRPPGSTWKSGPRTWTEVGDGFLTHHVRYP